MKIVARLCALPAAVLATLGELHPPCNADVTSPVKRCMRILAAALIGISACGSTTSPTATSTPSPAGSTTGGVAGCAITTAAATTPLISDPKSPYFDQLGVARTTDGATASGYAEVLAHASAPDATRLPDGSLGVYYHNGSTGGSIWLGRLQGNALTPVSVITVDGVAGPRWMADPNTDLVNGRVRMIYMNGESSSVRRFCVADSPDGVTFTTRALAMEFAGGSEADPSVIQLSDGTWLMAFSRANHSGMGLARSSDGLTFTAFATNTHGVVPELAALPDGRVRLYACTAGNVDSYVSSDRGSTWTREGTVISRAATGRAIVCDPTYLASEGVFVFKTTDAL